MNLILGKGKWFYVDIEANRFAQSLSINLLGVYFDIYKNRGRITGSIQWSNWQRGGDL